MLKFVNVRRRVRSNASSYPCMENMRLCFWLYGYSMISSLFRKVKSILKIKSLTPDKGNKTCTAFQTANVFLLHSLACCKLPAAAIRHPDMFYILDLT